MTSKETNKAKIKLRTNLLLSLQFGLLGAITPDVRAVFIDWDQKQVVITAIFDGPVSEEECSDIDDVAAQVAADLHEPMLVDSRCLRVDAPAPYENFGELSYARKESRS